MITIDLGTIELYDSTSNQFKYEECGIVRFEYTLKVVYDWEAKWLKPFLKGGLTNEEQLDFYMMMALDPIKEEFITESVMRTLAKYIGNPNTATVFSSADGGQNGNQTTNKSKFFSAEEIYALMFQAQIPLDFENRNLNRLLTIIRIVALQNNPPKKMTQDEIYRQNKALNEERRKKYNTKG